MPSFTLHPVFTTDFLTLGKLKLSRVFLNNDSRYPWLTLIPERAGIEEIMELGEADRVQLMSEIVAASSVLKELYNPDKLNVGALGNHVRQLHVHVIGRFVSDPAWPGPTWGHSPAVPYQPHVAGITADRFVKALQPFGLSEIAA